MTTNERFFTALVRRLGARRADIIERVLAEVRGHPKLQTPRRLDRPQLRDHLPGLLDRVGAYLQGKPPGEARPPALALGDEHGHGRWEQRYRLDELVLEPGVVERVILGFHYGGFCISPQKGSIQASGPSRRGFRPQVDQKQR